MLKSFRLFVACFFLGLTTQACVKDTDPQSNDFQNFWNEFRTAVMNNDTAKVAMLTRFPFETRGEMDWDPVIERDKEWFLKTYQELLNHDPGLPQPPRTMRAFIEHSSQVTSKDIVVGDWARLGDFEFRRIDGKWWFTFAYFENTE